MGIKLTTTSSHPDFKPFDMWLKEKIAELKAANDFASADAMTNAVLAKTQAEEAAEVTIQYVDANTVIVSNPIVLPAFDAVMDQWIAQYSITINGEEV